jgi:hypothetical protein
LAWFALAWQVQAEEGPVRLRADTPWVVQADAPEPVQRALQDVQNDWRKVLGHLPVVLPSIPAKSSAGPMVYLGVQGPWLKDLLKDELTTPETFVLRLAKDGHGRAALLVVGSDVRGAIYAAYALSEELLGVDPWYFWTDHEPAARSEIDVPNDLNKVFGPPTVKYRGWFINDEDLLSGYSPDPLRQNVMSLTMYDRIYETLLRLRGNLVVPATFAFPDELCVKLAHRRGLAIGQHHIQVLGLNTWRWPNNLPYSYSRHPAILERNWEVALQAQRKYEMVWSVGYRGQHDRPFWTVEQGLDTPEARGELISRAMARQVAMIRQVQPRATIIANLWHEGAQLYHRSCLKLPPGVVLVWPDDGTGMLVDDGKVQAGQGAYYHTAMFSHRGNQLCEMVPPRRI